MRLNQTDTLQALIQKSLLLSEDQKARLLGILPMLDETRLKRLEQHLSSEGEVVDELVREGVTHAVQSNGAAFLQDINDEMSKSGKSLRIAEEAAEQSDEQSTLDHMFSPDPPHA